MASTCRIIIGSAISIDADATYDTARYNLMGYTNSSMEAAVWEEFTNIPSISTVRSLQMGYNTAGSTVDTINHDNAGNIGTTRSPISSSIFQQSIKNYVQGRQNFNSYVEVDPNSHVTVSTNTVSYSTLPSNNGAYVYGRDGTPARPAASSTGPRPPAQRPAPTAAFSSGA